MSGDQGELFRLGKVIGVHGLRGDLKVRPESPDAAALSEVSKVFLHCRGEAPGPWRLLKASPHKGLYLLRLAGVDHADNAKPLVGCEVLVQREDLPELAEGDAYWADLEGMTVLDRRRGEIGTLSDLFVTAAHGIYVVNGPYGEVLIPAVDAFIVEIDLPGRRLTVDLPEGLVPESDEI